MQQRLSDTNFLYELDQVTQDIEKAIMAAQPMMVGMGTPVALPHATEKVCVVPGKERQSKLRC